MKITIKYEYDPDAMLPYWAITFVNGKALVKSSATSYDDAKEKLLASIRGPAGEGVPEPEEVEV